jgi:hypothetical protein
MTLANVVRGKIVKPIRCMVFGIHGVGKSTFAADAPSPIFLCSEDGTAQLDVARLPTPRSWADVLEAIRVLTHEEHDFKTLVIDTLDWLEPLCWAQVCAAGGKAAIEDFGYGKGYVAALDVWRGLIARLEQLERTRKMHIVLLAHAAVKKHDDPFAGQFDRYRMKLHEKAGDLLAEWVDALLFARHEVAAVKGAKDSKARGVSSGARILHTQWTAAFDAKNRFGLPEEMPLSWADFEAAVKAAAPADPAKLLAELDELLPRLAPERAAKVRALVEGMRDDSARLAKLVDQVRGQVLITSAGDES